MDETVFIRKIVVKIASWNNLVRPEILTVPLRWQEPINPGASNSNVSLFEFNFMLKTQKILKCIHTASSVQCSTFYTEQYCQSQKKKIIKKEKHNNDTKHVGVSKDHILFMIAPTFSCQRINKIRVQSLRTLLIIEWS